jgi:hypothetical protein
MDGCVYKVSISKSCCPVCYETVGSINNLPNPKSLRFQVHAHHSTVYLADLPSFLPESVQDQIIMVFQKKLMSELLESIENIKLQSDSQKCNPIISP